jgi:hypothetical protein
LRIGLRGTEAVEGFRGAAHHLGRKAGYIRKSPPGDNVGGGTAQPVRRRALKE